jgi:hypothetical protein
MDYRVVDLRDQPSERAETVVTNVRSPEAAASTALGIDVVRSGSRATMVARVYWQYQDQPLSMVRLYRRIT